MSKTSSLIIGGATALIMCSVTPLAQAVDAPVMERNAEIRENNQQFRGEVSDTMRTATAPGERREEIRTLNQARIASNSAARQAYRSERAQLHGERIDLRFSYYAQRLSNIALRIQTRIDTQKADEKDTMTAQAALDQATDFIAQATADTKTAVSMFQTISISVWSTQSAEVKAAITQANKARTEFVSARLSLIDATAALQ